MTQPTYELIDMIEFSGTKHKISQDDSGEVVLQIKISADELPAQKKLLALKSGKLLKVMVAIISEPNLYTPITKEEDINQDTSNQDCTYGKPKTPPSKRLALN